MKTRLFAAVLLAAALPAAARCIDDNLPEAPPPMEAPAPAAAGDPRSTMQQLVREAVVRSQAIGAARLLAEAAAEEIGEARAAGEPQASLSGSVGPALNSVAGNDLNGLRATAALNIGAPLFDAGRVAELTDWRKALAEAARLGQISVTEQISLQTVSLTLERSRYRLQEQVYLQYARKMSCLVEALQTIVDTDPGRGSELVQAKKTLQQVELSAAQTRSTMQQIEVQLRRFVGPQLPSAAGASAVIVELPPMADLLDEAGRASEIGQMVAQADALDSYSRAVTASQKPQLNWAVTGAAATGTGPGNRSSSLGVAVTFSVPLLDPGAKYTSAAAQRRAQAAHLQAADALEGRRARIGEVYEQASAAFARAHDIVDVLKNSDRVRSDTLQLWRQIGRRSLFDVMSAESDHYGLRIAYVNALHDAQQSTALLWSLGLGVSTRLQ